ncbi:2-amino-3,7-dideoxy-D-threo-hept-6-ulosonate synthase [Saccharothrix obliqua]|uniref:2-amino-3,7-dideoxy-D-threo-hept-6-ulosonate synthase n=1 Tax=Saccharothrix obliqua TaxID=2861747 RepID=UPI0027E37C44|nr:2-amino-3,7-dideoxy-D-threo-hept-6-ulosonate synthase [Saccharothrix obliqua]
MRFDIPPGKALRLRRLSRHGDGHHLIVPLDHSVSDGPVTTGGAFTDLVSTLTGAGADAVVVHRGRVRSIDPAALHGAGLVVHLSASTRHAPDADAKVLVAGVEDAVRLGADAVSVHLNIGSDTEARQLADAGAVATECDRLGVPLLLMVYLRGPRVVDPHDAVALAHLVNIAADLGADLVKSSWADPLGRLSEVVAASPIPVLVAGGPSGAGDLAGYARAVLDAGCAGLAVGRRVFEHPNPASAVRALAALVHRRGAAPVPASTRALAGTP